MTLSKETYKALVNMAIEKYGHAKAISKVIEDLIREKMSKPGIKKIIRDVEKLMNEGLVIKTSKDIVEIVKESRDEMVKD